MSDRSENDKDVARDRVIRAVLGPYFRGQHTAKRRSEREIRELDAACCALALLLKGAA